MGGWGKIKAGAQHAGVSERTFRNWLKQGLKHIRLPSGTVLVKYADIDAYLESFAVGDDQVEAIVSEVVREMQL